MASGVNVVPSGDRSISNPVSVVAGSVHARLICVLETAVAVSPVGGRRDRAARLRRRHIRPRRRARAVRRPHPIVLRRRGGQPGVRIGGDIGRDRRQRRKRRAVRRPLDLEPGLVRRGSVHARLICVLETAVAVSPVGAAGTVPVVCAVATFDHADAPVPVGRPHPVVLVVPAVSPVCAYVVTLAATVASGVNVVPSGDRSISNPVSFVAVSVHARLICVLETAVAVSPVGAAGTVPSSAPSRRSTTPTPPCRWWPAPDSDTSWRRSAPC